MILSSDFLRYLFMWGEHMLKFLDMEVRRQFAGTGSLFPPPVPWGLNSGHQAWWLSPSLMEPTHQSLINFYNESAFYFLKNQIRMS